MSREDMKPFFVEYKKDGGVVSPMNTESCRKYIANRINEDISQEDVLWLYYNTKRE